MSQIFVNYPALHKSSDKASIGAQNTFIWINLINLFSLITASIFGSFDFQYEVFVILAGILLLISLVLTALTFYIKFEKKWYEGRAIAESIKTLTWKFMMGAQPFDESFELAEAEARIIKNFKKIIGQKKEFFELIGGEFGEDDQVTSQMREIRAMNMIEKKDIYIKQRLDEQRKWYSKKASENKGYKNVTFWMIISLILLSFIGLYINIKFTDLGVSFVPITVVIASSLIAWMQLKRYQELTQSYSITANELGLIKSKSHHIEDSSQLSDFVDDAENAISREHTLWLARRDNIELFS